MCSSKQIKELAECNAVYEFKKVVNMYGKEYIRYYYNKLAELLCISRSAIRFRK